MVLEVPTGTSNIKHSLFPAELGPQWTRDSLVQEGDHVVVPFSFEGIKRKSHCFNIFVIVQSLELNLRSLKHDLSVFQGQTQATSCLAKDFTKPGRDTTQEGNVHCPVESISMAKSHVLHVIRKVSIKGFSKKCFVICSNK